MSYYKIKQEDTLSQIPKDNETTIDRKLMDEVLKKINGREKFSYDLNGDALYQQYKDKYIQQGKMAMQDTMGQAAAMTGGYGNSYAATVGNQAYQAQLNNLNDVIPELYQMAYDKYNQEGQDLYNQYALLSDDIDRKYRENRDIIEDQQKQAEFDEAVKLNSKQDAYAMIQAGMIPSDELLAAAGLSKADVQKLADAYKNIGGSGGGGGNKIYANGGDDDGEFHKAIYSRTNDDGTVVWEINGKEVIREKGRNPYTGGINKDILGKDDKGNTVVDSSKTFSNGYQPNNVNGKKLSKTGLTDVVNGVTQNVWQTPDGQKWIWDGTQNKYLKYED